MGSRRILIGLVIVIGLLVISWQVAGYVSSRLRAHIALENLNLNQPFIVKKGETGKLLQPKLIITVNGISDDSRCPQGQSCSWAGQATVHVKVSLDKEADSLDFISRPGGDLSVAQQRFKGYLIKLEKLDPYPTKMKQRINEQQYQATFVVSSS